MTPDVTTITIGKPILTEVKRRDKCSGNSSQDCIALLVKINYNNEVSKFHYGTHWTEKKWHMFT